MALLTIKQKSEKGLDKNGRFIKGRKSERKGKSINLDLGKIKCYRCSKDIIKTNGKKKYCEICRRIKDIEKTRNYETKNKKKSMKWAREHSQKWRKENPEISRVYTQTNRKIETKLACEICGSTNNLQKHHWRYDKPLLVNTLCKVCHDIQHVKNFNESKYARQMEITQ